MVDLDFGIYGYINKLVDYVRDKVVNPLKKYKTYVTNFAKKYFTPLTCLVLLFTGIFSMIAYYGLLAATAGNYSLSKLYKLVK